MWGIIPAAGNGTRIQPLAFSKELLPVGSRIDDRDTERPRAISEYLVERMLAAGAGKLCFVISPWKSDIPQYFGGAYGEASIVYAVQDAPRGLCDAIFRALPVVAADEDVVIGLPDTIWFPEDALARLPAGRFSFLLFPVERPELFDAVETDADGRVREVVVKSPRARSHWIWGALRLPGAVLHALHALWQARGRQDEYLGTLVNAWLAAGGEAFGVRAGTSYVDVGTLHGWKTAMALLDGGTPAGPAAFAGKRAAPPRLPGARP
ncbi:Glucose-1-phosphate thymidylyltransferase [Rhodovastum atsumiense]|uniref:glucose-1-phosphate thymidylyltransferase n=1 Tax=Rhodovastum atsumiense TaxID=504468 RepID=A0A5M6IMR0_9PROT|nr:sugar phosphate nucleotidyltransferase [Rhodovastum atsumiense]KAA5608845.1 nucleotidyltransferase family protein [Rhodovastum atsumiense]CAH2599328.1 Glucose-1-phosphate thymidylyltransferase [Rhodovastum atsumiense]